MQPPLPGLCGGSSLLPGLERLAGGHRIVRIRRSSSRARGIWAEGHFRSSWGCHQLFLVIEIDAVVHEAKLSDPPQDWLKMSQAASPLRCASFEEDSCCAVLASPLTVPDASKQIKESAQSSTQLPFVLIASTKKLYRNSNRKWHHSSGRTNTLTVGQLTVEHAQLHRVKGAQSKGL